jgi:uroporphyrinogen decarboxylase
MAEFNRLDDGNAKKIFSATAEIFAIMPATPMTDLQWNNLLAVLRGEILDPPPVGFIIDCPWLPGWCGRDIADYLSSETLWFDANRKAIETFPDVWFLPGFWSEFGMCTEPAAFGSKCRFPRNEFPFAEKIITDVAQIADLAVPDVRTDGLLPFMLNRLRWAQPLIEAMGHKIRFSVSRGPLNVATFLMGTTEFLMAIKTDPEPVHRLLRVITDFLKQWHALQREMFPTIAGMMMLDDIVGFVREADFVEFGLPYFRELYDVDVPVKFFHNDAPCAQSLRHYADIGINLYNPGVQTSLTEMRRIGGNKLTILGNVPPRDVLAQGTSDDVRSAVKKLLAEAPDRSRLILSCAGGVPPGVSTANLQAFIETARWK